MKRLWIGTGLLAAVLVTAVLTPAILSRCHTPAVQDLQRAAELVMADNWDTAASFSRRAEKQWQKTRPVTAAFSEHEPMEEIDALFAQLKIYREARDQVAYGSTCVYIACQMDALRGYHDFNFGNLF